MMFQSKEKHVIQHIFANEKQTNMKGAWEKWESKFLSNPGNKKQASCHTDTIIFKNVSMFFDRMLFPFTIQCNESITLK